MSTRYTADVRRRLDPRLTNRAVTAMVAMGVVVVSSTFGDWPLFRSVLAVFIASTLFNAIVGRKVEGLVNRRLPNTLFALAGGSAIIGYGLLTGWSMPAVLMVPLYVAVYTSFSDGDTRPYVLALLAVVMAVMHWSGQPYSTTVPLMLLSFGIHWMSDGRAITLRAVLAEQATTNEALVASNAALAGEMTARLLIEAELRQAQKLESVGRLAAGIAHEINTPAQFVKDSVEFLGAAVNELTKLLKVYQAAAPRTPQLEQAEADADAVYLLENLPAALKRSLEGIARINVIVRSMKEFAHPAQKEMHPVDLNRAIASTLVVAASEYKLVADLETDFGPVPGVVCHGDEVNQVVLNLVVNAAHAIADGQKAGAPRGKITVRTRCEGDCVLVSVADTGSGISDAIRDHIFEPFFTTKEVGRGTGQGLAIARSVVAKHGGQLTFETRPGVGTTFFIKLLVDPRENLRAAA